VDKAFVYDLPTNIFYVKTNGVRVVALSIIKEDKDL